VADIHRAISKGIVVSLGTDGPASNNSLDMFETTKIASLLAKGVSGDTTRLSSKQTFMLATSGGAQSTHQENLIGGLFEGAKADMILLDLTGISALPFYDPYNYITYSARSSNVRDVFVDGRHLIQNGRIMTVNLDRLREKVTDAIAELHLADPRSIQ
jgi:5-methylthioadenosine/S-adenosylhomocysteine deaminase